jgi:hypothetical protein
MRKLIVGFALSALSAFTAGAQVQYKVTNFTLTTSGFAGSLEFRNINNYGDADIYSVDRVFGVGVTQRVKDFCTSNADFCEFYGPSSQADIGLVGNNNLVVGGIPWIKDARYYGNGGFAAPYKFSYHWDAMSGTGLWGCQLPQFTGIVSYAGRTCDADGFTGSLSVDFTFTYNAYTTGATIALTEDDVVADFTNVLWPGPNAYNVVPEPATYAMTALGLGVLALARRKRAKRSR